MVKLWCRKYKDENNDIVFQIYRYTENTATFNLDTRYHIQRDVKLGNICDG